MSTCFPLCPRTRTLPDTVGTSHLCHKPTNAPQQISFLFYHLVGATEQREWDVDAERLGGLEVYEELNFRRLHDRQVGRLHASENFPGISTEQTVIFRFIGDAEIPDLLLVLQAALARRAYRWENLSSGQTSAGPPAVLESRCHIRWNYTNGPRL